MPGVAVITAFCRLLQFICASVIYPARNPTTKKTTAVSIVSFFILSSHTRALPMMEV
jgi:hypothetical protein